MSIVSEDVFVLGKSLPIEQNYAVANNLAQAKEFYSQKKSILTVVDWDYYYLHAKVLAELLNQRASYPFPIFFTSDDNLISLLQQIDTFSFSAIVTKSQPEKLQRHVLMSLEKLRLKKQEQELLHLMESQNKDLEVLSQTLESKQQEQKVEVEASKYKVSQATKKLEAIQRVIVALYTADSLGEMETLLLQALKHAVSLEQVKLVLANTPWSETFAEGVEILKFPIRVEEQKLGDCYFVSSLPWPKVDENWLSQITEMIAIAVDRWLSLERGVGMKENWEASFRSIQSTVAVIDENYNLLVNNQIKTTERNKCYKVLFGHDQPCYGCKLGKSFQVTYLDRKDNDLHIYEVKSQAQFDEVEEAVFVNIYEDVTPHVRRGRERVEAAKLSELGIIGSSIAHELNNPLSGVLSYIQILLTEVPDDSEFHHILEQMEEGAKRCRQIIQNLLSFTRFSKSEEETDFLLHEMVEKALLFSETKSHSLGVNVTIEIRSDVVIRGSENLFLQALLEVIKNAMEEFSEVLQVTPNYHPKLLIRQSQNTNSVILDIIDNGRGIPVDKLEKVFTPLFTLKNPSHNRGLGLTTAYQILQSMKGRIEIFSVQPSGVQVRMVVPAKNVAT
jgi:two-component system NtrC family sensor kinase